MVFPTIALEKKLWSSGFLNVAGLDEAGRGPFAGPVVAAAVVIHKPEQIVDGVTDSKMMSKKARERAFNLIKTNSSGYGIGVVESYEIDALGLQRAVKKAMILALNQTKLKLNALHYLIVDGKNVSNIEGYKMYKVDKGDSLHYSIAAASVIAKVTRDKIMREYAVKYPCYGFELHVGYGTKAHIEAINKYGICEIHRKSFAPIKKFVI